MKLNHTIIIEGPDGSGKTGLYHRLVVGYGFRAAGHDGGPPKDAADAWSRLAWLGAYSPAVRDRCPAISDIIYSELLEREAMVDPADYWKWLDVFSPVVIFCRPPLEVILSHAIIEKPHKARGHVDAIKNKRSRLVELYDRTAAIVQQRSHCPVFIYNYTVDLEARGLVQQLKEVGICVD